jgi:hypothetical protein
VASECSPLHGDRYVIEGVDKVEPNAKVCIDVDTNRFLQLFVDRIKRKVAPLRTCPNNGESELLSRRR